MMEGRKDRREREVGQKGRRVHRRKMELKFVSDTEIDNDSHVPKG